MPDLNLEKCSAKVEMGKKMQPDGHLYISLLERQLQRNDKSKEGFNGHFQLFALVNAMYEDLAKLLSVNDTEKGSEIFYTLVSSYIPIQREELFVINDDKITDINWQNVKYTLLQKLIEEDYVTLSVEERALFEFLKNEMPSDANMPAVLSDANMLDSLIPHGYELVQCLKFFSKWTMEQQATLVVAYLQNKPLNEQKELLILLKNEAPQLTAQLRTQPDLQTPYFEIAIAENDIKAARTYIDKGADIHAALLQLFALEHRRVTLNWLSEHPEHLQKLTAGSFNTVIPYCNQSKTIAEILVLTKKGRKLLLKNESLQVVFSQTAIGDRPPNLIQQAQSESNHQMGFFKNSLTIDLTTELIQEIVYGNLEKAEKILKDNPALLDALLTEEATVEDYSGRMVKRMTAFQAALCAWDNEMCEMLATYMSKEAMEEQYSELFPEGRESYYSAQTSFDFDPIVNAITKSNDADVQKALNFETDTPLWEELEQFRAAFTQHSCQEEVFNPQHLLKAFELYDSQFDNWTEFDNRTENQQDLFWRQVIGYTQRFLPANIAMDFAQGLYFRVEKNEKPLREFDFRCGYGSIFPLSGGFLSGLGYNCGVDYCGGTELRSSRDELGRLFSKLRSNKNSNLERMIQPKPSYCFIQ